MSDDFVLNVRQIGQYPQKTAAQADDALLIQTGGINGNAGAYASMTPADLVSSALAMGGSIQLAAGDGMIAWNGDALRHSGSGFSFTRSLEVPTLTAAIGITLAGENVATQPFVLAQITGVAQLLQSQGIVNSWNGRHGNVLLSLHDILSAGGAQLDSPFFIGRPRAPTNWNSRTSDDTIATTAFVWSVINDLLCNQGLVFSFNGRGGDVVLTTEDINAAYFTTGGTIPRVPHPAPGDASNRIPTTGWVTDEIGLAVDEAIDLIGDPSQAVIDYVNANFAPLVSPQLSGVPTAPTAAPGSTTGQIATTAFVTNAVSAGTAGVASFNTRTGAVTLITADVTAAGGAPIASPALTGNPTAPTPATADSDTSIATTAFVHAVVTALPVGVASFNTRTGAVTLTTADITGAGGAPTASPAFSGVPSAPTATAGTNTTQLATTAFVTAATAAATAGVSSWNGRTGAVTLQANDVSAAGGALNASPSLTGTPLAPTAAPGTNTQQIATTAYVLAALGGGATVVSSFNGRTGVVTLTTPDITGAGGAPLASPALTGTPTAPTALQAVNDTTIATTAYVHAAITATTGVASFNTRTGAVTLAAADITGAGGALLASPTFTGTPAGPTAAPGANTTQLATTAFVTAAVNASVTSFNSRTGAVTLIAADITAAGGALVNSPTFTGTPNAPTPSAGTNNTQISTTAFVMAAVAAAAVTSFNTRTGAVTLSLADVTGAGGAPLASPALSGTPTAPTASAGTNTTQVASTAFVLANAGAGPGSRALIQSQVISAAVASVNFTTGIDATYDAYVLEFYDVRPATADSAIALRISTNGGTTYLSGATDYYNVYAYATGVVGNAGFASEAVSYGYLSIAVPSAATGPRASGTIRFWLPTAASVFKSFMFESLGQHSTVGTLHQNGIFGHVTNNAAINALQIKALPSGNLTSGTFNLYGIRK